MTPGAESATVRAPLAQRQPVRDGRLSQSAVPAAFRGALTAKRAAGSVVGMKPKQFWLRVAAAFLAGLIIGTMFGPTIVKWLLISTRAAQHIRLPAN